MSFSSISRFYTNKSNIVKPEYIFQKCKVLKINDNMSCYIRYNFKNYKLFLKGVPKVDILKNYLKYLCINRKMYVKFLKKDENHYENHDENIPNILGSLFTYDKLNVNILLVNRFNYLKKKYIYERMVVNSLYKKKKNKQIIGSYKPTLSVIKEEVGY